MRPKAIALVLDCAPRAWQSQQDLHYGICRTMQARGWGAVIIHSEPIAEPVRERYLASGIQLESCNYARGPLNYYRMLRRLVREHDVQLADMCFFNYFQSNGWLAKMAGIPHVVLTDVNGGAIQAKGWKLGILGLRAILMTWPFSHVIAISEFVRGRLLRLGINEKRIAVVYGGADTKKFHPDNRIRRQMREELGIMDDEALLVSVCYLKAIKRVDIQLDACALLKKRGLRFRLIVAGDGPMRHTLEQQAAQLELTPDTVTFLGHYSQPQRLFQAADLTLLSTEGEAFGLVLAEAMACGVPIVGTRSGGMPEIVTNGENGWLAEPNDPDSFACAIERLIQDRKELERMRITARRYAVEKFEVSAEIAATVAVYESIGALAPEESPLLIAS